MAFCSKCGVQNEDNAIFCFNCGAEIVQTNINNTDISKTYNNFQYTEKSSKLDNFISKIDYLAIFKGLIISFVVGFIILSYLGLFVGGLVAGYYTTSKWKNGALNGWIVGSISQLVFATIIILMPFLNIFRTDVSATFSEIQTGSDVLFLIIGMLLGLVFIGLIGAVGGIIGSKLSERRNKDINLN